MSKPHSIVMAEELQRTRDVLRELNLAVVGISQFTGAEMTDDSVAAWQRLNDAQVRARNVLSAAQFSNPLYRPARINRRDTPPHA